MNGTQILTMMMPIHLEYSLTLLTLGEVGQHCEQVTMCSYRWEFEQSLTAKKRMMKTWMMVGKIMEWKQPVSCQRIFFSRSFLYTLA